MKRILFVLYSIFFLLANSFFWVDVNSLNAEENPQNSNSPLGTNVAALEYWSTEWTIVDLFKSSGGWYTQNDDWNVWDTGEQNQLDLDANGWVKSLPASNDNSVQYRHVGAFIRGHAGVGTYPAGQYIVLYDGEGTMIYPGGATKNTNLSIPGRDVLDVPANSDGIHLKITQTDPNQTGNYIRNIRVLMPGTSESQTFHPTFLQDIAKYKVLRFMQYFHINSDVTGVWANRTKLTDARWFDSNSSTQEIAGPIEIAIQMVNSVNADPWLNMPYPATDNYIRSFAQLVKQLLSPNQKVYIEYGNEAWNTAWPWSVGQQYTEQQGEALWPNSSADGYTKGQNWYAKRAVEICQIWKQEWGSEDSRVKCVLSGQAGVDYRNNQLLGCPIWVENGGSICADSMDYFATAPYFGFTVDEDIELNMVRSWMQEADGGLNSFFQHLQDVILPHTYGEMDSDRAMTANYDIALITYEAGQHINLGWNRFDEPDAQEITLFLNNINRDTRMGQMYTQYLNEWKNRGGELLTHYMSVQHYNTWGSFDSKESQNQASTPKFDALMNFIDNNPCWWQGCSSSGAVGITDPTLVVNPVSLGFGGLPPIGQIYTDSAFNGTRLRRITNRTEQGDFAVHIYSQLQAFSSNNQYVLLAEDEEYVVRQVSDLSLANFTFPEINNPRWQPALSHTLVFYDTNADTTIRVQYGNVDTGSVSTIFTFPNNYDRIRGNQSFDELSHDGKWMAGMASNSNGDATIFSLDIEETPSLGAEISINGLYSGPCQPDPTWGQVDPDWIGASPLGNYLVVQWARDGTDRCSGLEAYNIQTGAYVGHINDRHDHGDLGVRSNGTEFFMSTVSASPEDGNFPAIMTFDLPNGVNSPQLVLTIPWGGVSHISCQGPQDLCVVSSYDTGGVLDNEIYLVFTDQGVRRLTHHRSSECGYWVQARASISRDGKLVIFDSDYVREIGGQDSCTRLGSSLGGGDVYTILLSDADLISPNNSSPPPSSVTLSADPTSLTMNAGQSGNYQIVLTRTDYSDAVDLSISGLPAGASANFAPDPVTGNSSTLAVNTNTLTTPSGTYSLNVQGSATGINISPQVLSMTIIVPDSDGDGLNDQEEDQYGTDPNNPDTDSDGMNDLYEIVAGTDPNDNQSFSMELFLDNFQDADISDWSISGSSNVSWSAASNELKASVIGSNYGYSYILPSGLDISRIKDLALSFTFRFEGGALWGGVWYRGHYLDMNPSRIGWRDNNPDFNASNLILGKTYRVLLIIRESSPYKLSDLYIDGKLYLKDEPIEISSWLNNKIGFVSNYYQGSVIFDDFSVWPYPNPMMLPLMEDFEQPELGPWIEPGSIHLGWDIVNDLVRAHPNQNGYGYFEQALLDVSNSDSTIEFDLGFFSGAQWGGLYYRGVYLDLNLKRLGWRDDTYTWSASPLEKDKMYHGSLIVRDANPYPLSTLYIDNQLMFENIPIEENVFSKINVGLVSNYYRGEVFYDNFDIQKSNAGGELDPIMFPIEMQSINAGTRLQFQLEGVDPQNVGVINPADLVYSSPDLPNGASLSSSGNFDWLTTFNDAGVYTMNIIFTDTGNGKSDTKKVRIAVNSPVSQAVFFSENFDQALAPIDNWQETDLNQNVTWVLNNNALEGIVDGPAGYSFYAPMAQDVSGISRLAIKYDVTFKEGAQWGGLWFRGVYLDLNRLRIGWRDNNYQYIRSTITSDKKHQVVIFIQDEAGVFVSNIYLNGELVLNETIDMSSFSNNTIGFVSPYYQGRMIIDNFQIIDLTQLDSGINLFHYFDFSKDLDDWIETGNYNNVEFSMKGNMLSSKVIGSGGYLNIFPYVLDVKDKGVNIEYDVTFVDGARWGGLYFRGIYMDLNLNRIGVRDNSYTYEISPMKEGMKHHIKVVIEQDLTADVFIDGIQIIFNEALEGVGTNPFVGFVSNYYKGSVYFDNFLIEEI